jgi:hypothetical protein
MSHMVYGIGKIFSVTRDSYIAVQDDLPESWNLGSTLTFIGLRALSPDPKNKKVPPTEEEARELFNALPTLEAPICLPTYSFIQANKLFASILATTAAKPKAEAPFATFLSLTSYLGGPGARQTTLLWRDKGSSALVPSTSSTSTSCRNRTYTGVCYARSLH